MAMDPILAAHQTLGRCFEVGGELSPASIRDQMVRAYLVVDRAFQDGLIGPPGTQKHLLVVGAGPSGLTAAARGAELGVETTLIEKRRRQAFRIARCRSRYIEPTLYDWALGHFDQNVIDWAGAPMAFRWRADKADRIALRWRRRIPSIVARHAPLLTITYDTTPKIIRPPASSKAPNYVDVQLRTRRAHPTTGRFGAVVSCVGLGRENTSAAPSYRGLGFWEQDDFDQPNCGLSFSPRILISGGGDGGLQDFIRVMTLRDTGAVLDVLSMALASAPDVLGAIAGDIQDAEDIAARALSWNLKRNDPPVFERLEAAHEKAVDDLQHSAFWPAIAKAIGDLFPRPLPQVRLAHKQPHFTQCYALNRFLTLLILRILDDPGIRMPNTDVIEVRCGHPGACGPKACHGQPHQVEYKVANVKRTDDYEVVILRHGIHRKNVARRPHTVQLRQLLPYFVEG